MRRPNNPEQQIGGAISRSRFHSPADWKVSMRRHFPGTLFSVSPSVVSSSARPEKALSRSIAPLRFRVSPPSLKGAAKPTNQSRAAEGNDCPTHSPPLEVTPTNP